MLSIIDRFVLKGSDRISSNDTVHGKRKAIWVVSGRGTLDGSIGTSGQLRRFRLKSRDIVWMIPFTFTVHLSPPVDVFVN